VIPRDIEIRLDKADNASAKAGEERAATVREGLKI